VHAYYLLLAGVANYRTRHVCGFLIGYVAGIADLKTNGAIMLQEKK
jgi:hypothetical protein